MQNANFPEMTWVDASIQWGFLFALLAIIFYPASKFANLAKRHNRTAWVYFFLGLLVGIIGLNLGHVVLFPFRYYKVSEPLLSYLSPVLLLSSYIFYRVTYGYLEKHFTRDRD